MVRDYCGVRVTVIGNPTHDIPNLNPNTPNLISEIAS